MRIAIYQPHYFPQLHYFNRMVSVDQFVILDNAQYTKALTHYNGQNHKREKSYQSDTRIRLPDGEILLTVPVKHKGYKAINKTGIDYSQKWNIKHLMYIRRGYQKAKSFNELYPEVEDLLKYEFPTLAALNIATIIWAFLYLIGNSLPVNLCTIENINKILRSKNFRLKKVSLGSSLAAIRPEGQHRGSEWTAAICQELGANEYLHGKTAKNSYMKLDYYAERGIKTITQNWKCTPYKQQFVERLGFSPNLSILDLLLNSNRMEAGRIIGINFGESSFLHV